MDGKKIRLHSELVYAAAILILSFAVAMLSAASFGVSMIVAPAYIISQRTGFLTFGQSEYLVQGVLFVVFCLLMKRVKASFFSSFVTCIIYGAVLDLWRAVVPMFNPNVTEPGSMSMPLRIVFFIVGVILTSFSVMLFFKTYLYPQVYDFFVKGVSAKYGFDRTKFKTCFDGSCLVVSCVMTLIFFKGFVGVGVGTLIMTVINGPLIGFFDKTFDKYFCVVPLARNFAKGFDL